MKSKEEYIAQTAAQIITACWAAGRPMGAREAAMMAKALAAALELAGAAPWRVKQAPSTDPLDQDEGGYE